MNTRKYPRTLNEAFPNTADYACAVERPAESYAGVLLAVAIGVGLAALLVAWWSS
jgi:hypothetical protein